MDLDAWGRAEGLLTPLGAAWIESARAYNFALYSKDAMAVSLLVYGDVDFVNPLRTFAFDFPAHKTTRIWHMIVPAAEILGAKYYAFRIDGPFGPGLGERFDRGKVLLDPYARGVFLPPAFSREAARAPGTQHLLGRRRSLVWCHRRPGSILLFAHTGIWSAWHPSAGADVYTMINCYWEDLDFTIQEGQADEWLRVVDTSQDSPNDILEPGEEERIASLRYTVRARSIVVLVRR